MKGDFSAWRLSPKDDHQAVLFQQGRLVSDTDLTEAEMIALGWRIGAARDIIGAKVAAVPAQAPGGFAVTRARVQGSAVELTLKPGRLWADGVPLALPGPANVQRTAGYFPPPANPAGTGVSSIGDGVRDAVVLQVELEDRSAFQTPERLLEPALGGPDTAARVAPRLTYGLMRLGPDETCHSLGARLDDDLSAQGRLTVSLAPPVDIPGDCPVFEGGGYSGFEHNLYRIEIAQCADSVPRFKWSMWNGGLVGRGTFTGGAAPHVTITANRAAILHCGQTQFYLEALTFDDANARWELVYGAQATLAPDGQLNLGTTPVFGTVPGSAKPVFFRLWNGLRAISDFTNAATPVELRDGIQLVFSAGGPHRAGSWWSFEVRAGEIVNPTVLINNSPPEGPLLSRVALAEIDWTNAKDTSLGGMIEDCRRRFRPLTNQKLCCTFVIGNGVDSFGDFNSLEEAAAHLPPEGGKLCLLPGQHFANLVIDPGKNIEISGCRHRTRVLPRQAQASAPVFTLRAGSGLRLSDLDIIAPFSTAVLIEGTLQDITLSGCRILGLTHAVRADQVEGLVIRDCDLWVVDDAKALSALTFRAKGAIIENNRFGVWPQELIPDSGDKPEDDTPDNPADPCFKPDDVYDNIVLIVEIIVGLWQGTISAVAKQPYRALGGIHVRGGTQEAALRANRIAGGLGHGIALGGRAPGESAPKDKKETEPAKPIKVKVEKVFLAQTLAEDGQPLPQSEIILTPARGGKEGIPYVSDARGEIEAAPEPGNYLLSAGPGLKIVDVKTEDGKDGMPVYLVVLAKDATSLDPDAAFLSAILIEDNDIRHMGLSGVGFWFLDKMPEPISPIDKMDLEAAIEIISALMAPVEIVLLTNITRNLTLRANRIEGNLRIVFDDLLRKLALSVALGGITLAQVEGLVIEGNRIVDNAPDAVVPVAGIYVGYGEEVIIAGNYIAGNGPLNARYTTDRLEGLRSGILIRLASSVLAGATEDGEHKPALVLRDNVVDQPAGRALTAVAYGPVLCVGNSFNSEREGAWSMVDGWIGSVFIVNLGGLHRLVQFAKAVPEEFTELSNVKDEAYEEWRKESRLEAMMPSGETLFNANRVRCGPDNTAWVSGVIVTADDLGFDGNQFSSFRPDMLFANLFAAANSLRVTDSRFRERARAVAYSALTITGGITVNAGDRSLNQTAGNQGDHCIVAMTYGSVPVVERDNQVVMDTRCPVSEDGKEGDKRRYLANMWKMLLLLARFGGDIKGGDVRHVIGKPYQSYIRMQARRVGAASRAGAAQEMSMGAAATEKASLALRQQQIQTIKARSELIGIREEPPPNEGMVLDGRVVDSAGRALAGQRVELVDARGRPTGLTALTDATGYYAMPIDAGTKRKLEQEKGLLLRAGTSGDVKAAVTLTGSDNHLRTELAMPGLKAAGSIFDRAPSPFVMPLRVVPEKPKPPGDLDTVTELSDPERDALRKQGITTLAALREFDAEPKRLDALISDKRRLSALRRRLKKPDA